MRLKPRKVISIAFTSLVLLLALPASVILATWNTLPGDRLYPIKRGLEKTTLALLPDSTLEMYFRNTLLDQRTTEAIAIIQQASDTNALEGIVTEAQAATLALVNLETNAQPQATEQLIEKLAETNRELETIKQTPVTETSQTFAPQIPTIIYQPTTIAYKTVEPENLIPEKPTTQTYTPPPTPKAVEEPQPSTVQTASDKIPNQDITPEPTITKPITTSTATPPSTPTAPQTPQTTDQQIHQTQVQISKMIIDLQQQKIDHQQKSERYEKIKEKKQKDKQKNYNHYDDDFNNNLDDD